ncbi:MAG: hypothetical protein AB8G17_19545 [Gammaproteobacteria bacterium]
MRCALATLCALVALAASPTGDNQDGAWTPISTDLGSIRFAAHISGREVRVRLGSASPSNSINEAFLRSLPSSSATTPEGVAIFDLPPLVDLPMVITSRRIVLPSVYRLDDPPYDIHAGRDFFSGHIVQIDYPNMRLRALDQDALEMNKLANVRARRVNQSTGTLIQINIAGQEVWAALATEFSGALMIPRGLATQHGWLASDQLQRGALVDAHGNEYVNEGFSVPYVGLGPFQVDDVDAVVMEEGESPLAGSDAEETVIVGNDVLRHFQLSIDLDRAYVHVQTPAAD